MPSDLIRVLDCAVALLEALSISYAIGGSVASSAHGEPRPSADVDLVIDLPTEKVEPLAAGLSPDFHVPRNGMQEAVARGSYFNAIHLQTIVKLDFFVRGEDPLRKLQIERARPGRLDPDLPRSFRLSSAEDIILQKLAWFRRGGEVSDRQWRDVLGVMKLQGDALDHAYLADAASHVGLTDLVDRARRDAGQSAGP